MYELLFSFANYVAWARIKINKSLKQVFNMVQPLLDVQVPMGSLMSSLAHVFKPLDARFVLNTDLFYDP